MAVLGAEWLQARVASRAAAIEGGALHERLQRDGAGDNLAWSYDMGNGRVSGGTVDFLGARLIDWAARPVDSFG